MKVLIAPDKFKGSLNSQALCDSIANNLLAKDPNLQISMQPLADGGDGTLEVIKRMNDYNSLLIETIDPLGRPIIAEYISDGSTAFIELTKASGIIHLSKNELNVLKASTRGTGMLIKHALENGHEKIIMSLGGSCSNDMGLGIAHVLGFNFIDKDGNALEPCGGNLHLIKDILWPKVSPAVSFTLLFDVDNPLYGPHGAAHTFAKQKGASPSQILQLDQSMQLVAKLIEKKRGINIQDYTGGGAAGGVVAGLAGLLNNLSLQSGFEFIAERIGLKDQIESADVIITGEGMLDHSSFGGKVIGNISRYCQELKKPLLAVVGSSTLDQKEYSMHGISRVYQIMDDAKSLDDALARPQYYIQQMDINLSS